MFDGTLCLLSLCMSDGMELVVGFLVFVEWCGMYGDVGWDGKGCVD